MAFTPPEKRPLVTPDGHGLFEALRMMDIHVRYNRSERYHRVQQELDGVVAPLDEG